MIHICLTIDDNYAHLAELCINQICRVKHPDTEITFYILGNHVTSFRNLLEFERYPGICVRYTNYDITKRLSIDIKSQPHLTRTCWIRYFIPEIDLFEGINRVLYLDADVVVRKDLTELYRIDLQDAPVGVVKDAGRFKWFPTDLKTYLGFNTGVMIMDLPKLRELNYTSTCIDLTLKHPTDDQGVMNLWMRDKVCFLPPQYNLSYHYFKQYPEYQDVSKWNNLYGLHLKNLDELTRFCESATIWHFHGGNDKRKKQPITIQIYQKLEQELAQFLKKGGINS